MNYFSNGTETGNPYADFLLGTPSNYTQSSGQPFYLRNRYFGMYAQDVWRARKDLTINAGLGWDLIMPWWEKFNQLQSYIPGAQSTLYPGAPSGLVVAGDPGVPKTVAPTDYANFAPRIGLAYSPRFEQGILSRIFGSNGQSSIRASYGLFYTAFQGLSAGIMYAVPPFGFNYLSPGRPLLAKPFISAATGVDNGQRFPFPFRRTTSPPRILMPRSIGPTSFLLRQIRSSTIRIVRPAVALRGGHTSAPPVDANASSLRTGMLARSPMRFLPKMSRADPPRSALRPLLKLVAFW
ncbi:hypothetical protein [Granulicella sp. dw_53]|uniref:hypothetical protein n=1 Tax=Granulicella sp. dw_53 TaxID=2719792 RepID=UPI00210392F6|nr:hypothetical protein [Granulicella sp. dw_53]